MADRCAPDLKQVGAQRSLSAAVVHKAPLVPGEHDGPISCTGDRQRPGVDLAQHVVPAAGWKAGLVLEKDFCGEDSIEVAVRLTSDDLHQSVSVLAVAPDRGGRTVIAG